MTRKQAIGRAIEVLEKKPGEGDIVLKLAELAAELPLTHWTEASVRDRVEQFRQEHGRLPYAREFRLHGMPPHTVIRQLSGMTVQAWLTQTFPAIQSPGNAGEKRTATRKQALERAIEALCCQQQDDDAAQKLRELAGELPIVHWTDASIRDRVEQFFQENGRFPTAREFKKSGMPAVTTIRKQYGMTVQQWLDWNNYTQQESDRMLERADKTECFCREYRRLCPKSSEDFNRRRASGIMGWETIALYNETKTWRDLLRLLGLPHFPKTREEQRSRIHVNIISDFDPYDDSWDRILGIR